MSSKRLFLKAGSRNPLICAKLNSLAHPEDYVRNLLDRYCADPSAFNSPAEVKEDVGTDTRSIYITVAIYNKDVQQLLAEQPCESQFVFRLIYLDIGRDPDISLSNHRPRLSEEEIKLRKLSGVLQKRRRDFINSFCNYLLDSTTLMDTSDCPFCVALRNYVYEEGSHEQA